MILIILNVFFLNPKLPVFNIHLFRKQYAPINIVILHCSSHKKKKTLITKTTILSSDISCIKILNCFQMSVQNKYLILCQYIISSDGINNSMGTDSSITEA